MNCTRRLQFSAGHRVFRHESKCSNLHGHNYVVEVTATAAELDELGRVVDFSVLKTIVGGWIEKHWDHGFIYYTMDGELGEVFRLHPEWKSFPLPMNPTAENMALYLLDTARELLRPHGVDVLSVLVRETENCWAEAVE